MSAKRSDGRYQVSVSLGRDPDTGKRIQKCFYGDTLRAAKAKRKAWQESQDKPAPDTAKTVSEWVEEWLEVYATGGYSMQQSHESQLKILTKALGAKPISEVLPADIQRLAKACAKYSKSYVTKLRRDIHGVFKAALENGIILKNPCDTVKWDHSGEGTHRALDQWERDLITQNWHRHPAGVWAMLMMYAGHRPGEALAQGWDNITDTEIRICDAQHFESNAPVIVEDWTKTGDDGMRTVPIVPPLARMLQQLPRVEHGRICRSAEGGEITMSAYRRNWDAFMNIIHFTRAGVAPNKRGDYSGIRIDRLPEEKRKLLESMPDITPYDLRHTFCSMLYDAGVDVKTAQYLMGHKTPEMTMRIYTHLSEQKKQRSYDALMKAFE